jgi:putative restriction endonuclease
MTSNNNAQIRVATFQWLAEQVARHGDVLPRDTLEAGFQFRGARVPLLGPQGIFKPQVLSDGPLSITSTAGGTYEDGFGPDGLLRYHYRRGDARHRDNVGLRQAKALRLPLVYFLRVVPGKYLAAWPVFVVADDPANRTVSVAVDDTDHMSIPATQRAVPGANDNDLLRRRYITAAVRVRLHQRTFRERVLHAYRRQCAFCRFRHEEMLDAAHIVPDTHPQGEPVVRNGLALCTLHHSAFDRYFIGLRPDYIIEVRPDILAEKDGPTLQGIQQLHGKGIFLPGSVGNRPDADLLSIRYEAFRKAS